MVPLLDTGVQGPTVTPETHGEDKVVLGRVPVEPEKRSDFEKYDRNAIRVLHLRTDMSIEQCLNFGANVNYFQESMSKPNVNVDS